MILFATDHLTQHLFTANLFDPISYVYEESFFIGYVVDCAVYLGFQHLADTQILVLVLPRLALHYRCSICQLPSTSFRIDFSLLVPRTLLPQITGQLEILLLLDFHLFPQHLDLPFSLRYGSTYQVVFFRQLALHLAQKIVQMINLLMHLIVVLSQLIHLLVLLLFHVVYVSILVLQCSYKFLVLSQQDLLTVLHHLDFLLKGLTKQLTLLHILITSLVLHVTDLFLKSQFVTDQNIIQFLILHRQVLNHFTSTLRTVSAALQRSSKFFIFR